MARPETDRKTPSVADIVRWTGSIAMVLTIVAVLVDGALATVKRLGTTLQASPGGED